jgi:hypothetical protein
VEPQTKLATTVRTAVNGAGTIREIRMFGGIGFVQALPPKVSPAKSKSPNKAPKPVASRLVKRRAKK